MTNIIVNVKNIEKKKIKMQDIQIGTWYRIVEYTHNEALIGEFGVATISYDVSIPRMICSPSGRVYSHEDLVLEEITKVEITCS